MARQFKRLTYILPFSSGSQVTPFLILLIGWIAILTPLPSFVYLVYGPILLVLPGVFLIVTLKQNVEPPLPELIVSSIGLGLITNIISVIVTSTLLSALGVSEVMSEPTLFIGPILLGTGSFVLYLRDPVASIPSITSLLRSADITPLLLMEFLAITMIPVAAASGAIAANSSGELWGSIAFYLSAGLLTIYLFLKGQLTTGRGALAIYAIALGTVLALTLRSGYIVGADVHAEVRTVKVVLDSGKWRLPVDQVTSTVASLTVLGPILVRGFNISAIESFKMGYPFFIAIIPVASFLLFRRVLSVRIAFITTMIAVSHPTFWGWMHSNNRSAIAILFMLLFLLSTVADDYSAVASLLYLIGIVISHYTIAFTFMIFLGVLIMILFVYRQFLNTPIRTRYSRFALFTLLVTFLWYGSVFKGRFLRMIKLGSIGILLTIKQYFSSTGTSTSGTSTVGKGSQLPSGSGIEFQSIPDILILFNLYFEFVMVFLGGIYIGAYIFLPQKYNLFLNINQNKLKEHSPRWFTNVRQRGQYDVVWLSAIVALILFVIFYIMPGVPVQARVQGQFHWLYLVLFPPGLVLLIKLTQHGIPQFQFNPRSAFVLILVAMFIVTFSLQTGLVYLVSDDSIRINLAGETESDNYVSPQDLHMVRWFSTYHAEEAFIISDSNMEKILRSGTDMSIDKILDMFDINNPDNVYVLTRSYYAVNPLDRPALSSNTVNKIYDTGEATIHHAPSKRTKE